jgi:hypothetical protein
MELVYKVCWSIRGARHLPTERHESEPLTLSGADTKAKELMPIARAVTILKECDGSDHPANKGKWFLYRIWK